MTMNLSNDSIPALLRKISIPTSVGFFFHTMFNVVDTYFAGQYSDDALASLSLSFPIFFSILAFGIGLSQGTGALISNALGAKQEKQSQSFFFQAVSFSLLLSISLTIVGLLIVSDLFQLLGASSQYLQLSLDYMNPIIIGSFLFTILNVFNGTLTARGLTKPFRNFLIGGFFANILLDPLLMFGLGPIPEMGISGLAISTISIEALGVIYLFWELKKQGFWQGFLVKKLRPNKAIFIQITQQALPASLNMLTMAAGGFVSLYFVGGFGKLAIAALGASIRIEQIILLPTIGFNSAVLTLSGHNLGAKKLQRIRESWLTALKWGLIMMAFGGFVLYYSASWLLGFFSKGQTIIETGSLYLSFASFTLGSYVIMFITNSMLQGIKQPKFPVYMGLTRQIIAPVLLFPILSQYFGIVGIWIGITGLSWTAALITLFVGNKSLKGLKSEQA